MNTLILKLKKVTPLRLIMFTLACFAFSPQLQALSPPPDGGYPNFTTAEGDNALKALTTGAGNTAIGTFSLFSVTTGNYNTAVGAGALDLNTADSNTATGAAALLFNTTGTENTANGTAALEQNNGSNNTANGAFALFNHVSGSANTATGWHALFSDVSGQANTATGAAALAGNTSGDFNTANGVDALSSNTEGSDNTAVGEGAMTQNIVGSDNTAVGVGALAINTSGIRNIALGAFAGSSQTTGGNNIYIGYNLGGTNGENNACYIKSIFGQTNNLGTAVFIDANHKLGTLTSSKRFKEEIKPMDKASEALFSLEPVSFRYKKEIDPLGKSQFGLVAEDVEKVNPDLVARDKEGKPYSVRYEQVNAMLLNEFLKEHHAVQELKATVAEQQKQIAALTAGLQKVSAELEVRKAAPQTVLNNQ
jgi:Chaperone of endosialidase